MKKKNKKALKAADALHTEVSYILGENDSVDPNRPRAGLLPTEWRAPLVRAANTYSKVRGGHQNSNPAWQDAEGVIRGDGELPEDTIRRIRGG